MEPPAATSSLELGNAHSKIRIPKQSGRAFTVSAGELVRVIDVEGEQAADFVAFTYQDRSLRFSTDQTRDVARTLYVTTGHGLHAGNGEELLTIVADDVGRHDMLNAWRRPELCLRVYGQENHPNCHDNLLAALAPHGVAGAQLPIPFNIFQQMVVHEDGRMEVRAPLSKPRDSIPLGAERDLLIAVPSCSDDKPARTWFNPTPIEIEIYGASENKTRISKAPARLSWRV